VACSTWAWWTYVSPSFFHVPASAWRFTWRRWRAWPSAQLDLSPVFCESNRQQQTGLENQPYLEPTPIGEWSAAGATHLMRGAGCEQPSLIERRSHAEADWS
jgi:hypothetical protein